MPNFSGIWSPTEQFQARAQNLWPAAPGAPTIGTATAGTNNCASVTFSAPTGNCFAGGVTSYTAISTPGCVTASGAASPLTVSCLSSGTSYTFRVRANNALGAGTLSAASNSITASFAGSQSYTAAGSYTWVAPAGVTSVSVVAIGGGGAGSTVDGCGNGRAGGGGGLGYKNNYPVTPGSSYSVQVGRSGSPGVDALASFFACALVVRGGLGSNGRSCGCGGTGGTFTGDGGGNGGDGGRSATFNYAPGGGGGAGGYSGNGGRGGLNGANGVDGSGGGGGGGRGDGNQIPQFGGGGGGGVGLLGQGANGSGATVRGGGGGGGSGGNSGGSVSVNYRAGAGGLYGGGGGSAAFYGNCLNTGPGNGVNGAVRIIWPGNTRSFPSTNAGNP